MEILFQGLASFAPEELLSCGLVSDVEHQGVLFNVRRHLQRVCEVQLDEHLTAVLGEIVDGPREVAGVAHNVHVHQGRIQV